MSDSCCSTFRDTPPATGCPSCSGKGKAVEARTLKSLLQESLVGAVNEDGNRFCTTKDCDVVYFRPEDGSTFSKADVKVPVWQKDEETSRPVCYCFGHTVASVHDEIGQTGKSTVFAEIKQKVKDGLCACEAENPQGSCCLGNVSATVKDGFELYPAEAVAGETLATNEESPSDCCASAGAKAVAGASDVASPKDSSNGATGYLVAASVITAVVASACCWLPLVLVGAGLSAAGAGAIFEQWRPVMLGLTALLLGGGFYLTYFRKEDCAPGSACDVPNRRTQRMGRAGLWLATFLVVSAATFPSYVGALVGGRADAADSAAGLVAQEVVLSIEGMTCEGCAAGIQKHLRVVPGVVQSSVDYASRKARVGIAMKGSSSIRQALVKTVETAGYRVSSTGVAEAAADVECCAGSSSAQPATRGEGQVRPSASK